MRLLNFVIIKLTLYLIIGIAIAKYFQPNFQISFCITVVFIIGLGIHWFYLKNKINRSPYFALIAYLCMVGIGLNSYNIQNEKIRSQHYTNREDIKAFNHIGFQVKKALKPDAYNQKYIVELISINEYESFGKLLVNIRNDSLFERLNIDDTYYTSAELKSIQKPLNPHQFNYSKYLELKQVYHQVYLKQDDLLQISNKKATIYGYADHLRQTINNRLISVGFKDDVLSIMNALLLGQRQSIDKSIYNNYVNSGTIHILAVSGLHVGILLWILSFLLKPILYLKYGRILRPTIIITILWMFAVIAGLSPSVTRAVTMFSIISVAMHLKRPANIYNTLAISAFFILLFKPSFLFEVGFQLSYLAVIGIVSIQPMIYKLWKPRYWIIDKPWQIFTVTLAAQIGVAPISLFYFHQFPGLFFISNLVVIPFLGIILGLGIFIIILSLFNILPDFLVLFYSAIINGLNHFIAWVAQFEDFLFRDIPFTLFKVILCYIIIISAVQVYKYRTPKWIILCLIAIIGFQTNLIYNNLKTTDDALIVFNKSRFSIIGLKQNDHLSVHHNLDSLKQMTDNVVRNYKVGEALETITLDSVRNIYQFNGKKLLVIDSLGVYKNLSFKPNYILLRNSPRINLNRLIDSLNPEKIIVDASNFKTYVNRWKFTCKNKKIPFHYTNKKGAFILK